MFKKAGVIAAAAAGLLMLGAPAFAGGVDNDYNGQLGLVNLNDVDLLKDLNLNVVAGACGNNLGLLGAALPVLSLTENCATGGVLD